LMSLLLLLLASLLLLLLSWDHPFAPGRFLLAFSLSLACHFLVRFLFLLLLTVSFLEYRCGGESFVIWQMGGRVMKECSVVTT
jgi:hypothetical protein